MTTMFSEAEMKILREGVRCGAALGWYEGKAKQWLSEDLAREFMAKLTGRKI